MSATTKLTQQKPYIKTPAIEKAGKTTNRGSVHINTQHAVQTDCQRCPKGISVKFLEKSQWDFGLKFLGKPLVDFGLKFLEKPQWYCRLSKGPEKDKGILA